MKKFLTVLAWLGLAACLILLVAAGGEKTSLRGELRRERQKYDALRTLYDEEKADWQTVVSSMKADAAALTLEKQTLAAALTAAQQEMAAVTEERDTLSAENQEASGRLSEIMAVLMPPPKAEEPEAAQPAASSTRSPALSREQFHMVQLQ